MKPAHFSASHGHPFSSASSYVHVADLDAWPSIYNHAFFGHASPFWIPSERGSSHTVGGPHHRANNHHGAAYQLPSVIYRPGDIIQGCFGQYSPARDGDAQKMRAGSHEYRWECRGVYNHSRPLKFLRHLRIDFTLVPFLSDIRCRSPTLCWVHSWFNHHLWAQKRKRV